MGKKKFRNKVTLEKENFNVFAGRFALEERDFGVNRELINKQTSSN